eukprot:CAMPEP_0117424898 /NCGR_PEP_ID=MMETSP0758-20121206/5252_1 /TAXON_ID=63605 /ORGANISM="Percolomonas cosmopolitus, Strain AE-1 (ATCC 50343)" /LENGTH=74 /DNA_ID=CAMNT_0005209007 /DNA_START=722 /DNA_END=943 /DNA_ORIENTATION=-
MKRKKKEDTRLILTLPSSKKALDQMRDDDEDLFPMTEEDDLNHDDVSSALSDTEWEDETSPDNMDEPIQESPKK